MPEMSKPLGMLEGPSATPTSIFENSKNRNLEVILPIFQKAKIEI